MICCASARTSGGLRGGIGMKGWRGSMPRVFMTMGILCIDIGCALMILYTICGQPSQPDIDCNLICIGFVPKMIAPAPQKHFCLVRPGLPKVRRSRGELL